ncbi:MAG: peptidase M15 [Alistipes sp.]|nr:peptidase M15 [Alistipes sp.]
MKYFTFHELTNSATAARLGIDNTPTAEEAASIHALVENVLDPAREKYGCPIIVNSGYRCARLNKAVGGVENSQHCKGEAADITTGKPSMNAYLARIIHDLGVYDQIILENANNNGTLCDWVHVSYCRSGNRKQILLKIKGVSGYKKFSF